MIVGRLPAALFETMYKDTLSGISYEVSLNLFVQKFFPEFLYFYFF